MKSRRSSFAFGAAWGLRFAGAIFVVEAIALAAEGRGEGGAAIAGALGLAAFLCGVLGLGLGIVLGLAAAYAAGPTPAAELVEERWQSLWAALWTPDPERRARFIARTKAGALLVVAALGLAFPIVWEVVSRIQTPLYAALISIGAVAGAGIVSLLLWPVWIRTGHLAASLIRRPPSPALTLALLGGMLLVALGVATAATWSSLASFVPWRTPLILGGAAILTVVWVVLRRRRPVVSRRRLILPIVGGALFLAGLITALALPRSQATAAELVEEATGPLAATHAAVTTLLDFDGDGALPWLGGGDCAPFDPQIRPGLWDEPGDGIDQDCDGQDSNLVAGAGPGRHDYPATPKPRPMPVILITVDAVSALHMELHGAKRKTMPNLTRRAATGAVFNWAFSEGPATRLSFPSLLSGLHNSQIDREVTRRTTVPWRNMRHSLGQVFSRAGYRTVSVMPDLYFAKRIRWLNDGFQLIDDSPAKAGAGKLKNGHAVTAAALARLDELVDHGKFLLWVHYTDAHYPHRLPKGVKATFGRRPADIYDRELQLLDDALEPLLAGIESRMAGRDHVVALTADHGQAFDAKHTKYHQDHDISTAVTWVPMIYWSPYSDGLRTDRVASIIDTLPTLLNMVGLEAPGIAGDSLLPTIQGAPDEGRAIMQQFYLPEHRARGKDPLVRVAIRRDRYVLHRLRSGGKEELYDYRVDPLELRNLIAEEPEVARQLRDIRASKLSWTIPDRKPEKARPTPPSK